MNYKLWVQSSFTMPKDNFKWGESYGLEYPGYYTQHTLVL